MTTNKTPVTWPLPAEEMRAIEHAARMERARVVGVFARGIGKVVRRIFGFGYPITIYVPTGRGRLTA